MSLRRISFQTFLGAGFLLVGTLQLLWALATTWTAERALHWPTVQGVISTSSVHVEPSRGGYAYTAQVRYTYQIGQNTYQGAAITAVDAADTEETVRATVAGYPAGSAVIIYVDPQDPHHALLRPGFFTYLALWLGLSVLAILLGIGLVVSGSTSPTL